MGKEKLIGILIYSFITLVVVLAFFFDGRGINLVTDLFAKLLISLVYSIAAGALVGAFTGNLFDQFNFKPFGIKFNIPTMILTFIVRIWLF